MAAKYIGRSAFMLVMTVALLAAACGGGEKATPTRPPATPVPPTATRPAATPTVTVAATPTAAPRPTATPTRAPATTPTAAVTQPRQGDKVAVGLDSLGSEVFISYHANSPDKPLLDPIYDYLLTFDVKTQGFTPGLATSWSIAPDGLKWTMKVREGVKFHDGGEFTAADVRFYVEKMLDPKSRQPFLSTWTAAIGAVQETSKYDVTINFKGLFAGFAEQISDFWQFPVMSKSYFDMTGSPATRTALSAPVRTRSQAAAPATAIRSALSSAIGASASPDSKNSPTLRCLRRQHASPPSERGNSMPCMCHSHRSSKSRR